MPVASNKDPLDWPNWWICRQSYHLLCSFTVVSIKLNDLCKVSRDEQIPSWPLGLAYESFVETTRRGLSPCPRLFKIHSLNVTVFVISSGKSLLSREGLPSMWKSTFITGCILYAFCHLTDNLVDSPYDNRTWMQLWVHLLVGFFFFFFPFCSFCSFAYPRFMLRIIMFITCDWNSFVKSYGLFRLRPVTVDNMFKNSVVKYELTFLKIQPDVLLQNETFLARLLIWQGAEKIKEYQENISIRKKRKGKNQRSKINAN